ncbi:BspA family leucine-rich repeat surface protein [Lactiplantibacillus plantarum]|uniref:BspA family leucine-rich repeat surface protein n=1 Tax=Lactiplantibacillus plantarum TaxID=1590 RepID=UPI0028FC3192|nr:BspA family leucine-rich repeat surface protein [Lactiplantibacillus plantarum]WNW15342.1 BspA family leucine-rich repeat surface protein [Lactiplantibacillus plantarum]WNW18316.1 BspA family leucine-rich repeat surface protein [Lactiplantibacillus plantarum]
MQHRQLWYRGGLGLALALVVVGYRGSRTVIRAVPRAQLSVDQKMPSTSSVFSASKLTLQDEANNSALQVSPEAQESAGPDKQSDLTSGSSTSSSGISSGISSGNSSGSTILENTKNNQTSETATTKAAEMVNGTVKMTLDTNGTLHLSGGSFGASLESATGSWIVKTLTANGYQPTQVSKIVIDGKITATTMTNYSYLFANLPNVTAIDGLANLNLTGVTDISWLFLNCSQLGALDLNSWDVSSVIRMEGTFQNCAKLVTLNVANWNTDSLQYLIDTFNGDSSLTSLPVGKWNTSKVATMMRTFTDCSSLTSLDIANWDTRVVTNMSAIFRGMSKVKSLPIDKWQTGRVVNMQLVFSGDTSLESINVANWDTSRATALDGTFAKLPNIKSLPLDNWNTSNVQTIRSTFYGDTNLTQLPIDNWNVGKVFDFNSTFSGCASLTTAPVANWNTQSATNLGYTFEGMTSLTSLPVDNWQTGNVTTMRGIFTKVSQVKNLPVGKWNTAKVVDMGQVFYGNPQLTSLPIENWNTSSATDFSQLFAEDSGLQNLSLGAWNTTKVTNFESVFQNTSLDKLDLTGWNTNSAQTYTNAFSSKLPPKRLLLGPSFNFFKSESWHLPNPSSEAPYIGKWRSLNNKKVYTSADLMTKYDGKTIVGEFEWATGNTITVKYVDAAGKSLAPDTKISGATGDAYHIKPIEIQGYVPDQPDGVQGNFTDKDETITLMYSPGGLMFASAPQTINFGQNPITGKSENYGASYDTGLVIQDGRSIGSTWSLNATLSASGFTSKQSARPLAAVLSYKDQQTGGESILTPGVARLIVNNHQTVSNQGVNILGQKTALGALSLQVPTDRALTDTYQATVTWTLNQGVPNR